MDKDSCNEVKGKSGVSVEHGFFCRCMSCTENEGFFHKLLYDIENNTPFGEGEGGV